MKQESKEYEAGYTMGRAGAARSDHLGTDEFEAGYDDGRAEYLDETYGTSGDMDGLYLVSI